MNSEQAYLKLLHIKKTFSIDDNIEMIPKLKSIILENPKYCYYYLNKYNDLPNGEQVISKSSEWSYRYARDIIRGPWKQGELAISENHLHSIRYVREVTHKPFDLIHPSIFHSEYKKLYIDFLYKYNYQNVIRQYGEFMI